MIGIDVSDRSIKVVQLIRHGSRQVISHCMSDVPSGVIEAGVVKDASAMQGVIKKALHACSINLDIADAVVASIPETQSFLRVIEVPLMQEDEVGEAVQWEVAQHIPFGLENVYVDWQPISSHGHTAAAGKQEILVGAAQKKVVDPLQGVFTALKLDVAVFELESQALTRSLISSDLKYKQGILLVDLGGASTNVIIHDHGTIRFTASLQKGSDRIRDMLSPEEITAINTNPDSIAPELAASVEGKLTAMYQELVVEVKGIVEFYNGIDVQHEVREIVLTGGGSNFPGLGKAFLKVFDNVHIQRGNPWVNIVAGQSASRLPMGMGESVRFATALGLAQRSAIV